jgi:hypothetical protein
MDTRPQEAIRPAGEQGTEKTPREVQAGEDDCRCKVTAGMKPRELLKLMGSDLMFWKKKKQG